MWMVMDMTQYVQYWIVPLVASVAECLGFSYGVRINFCQHYVGNCISMAHDIHSQTHTLQRFPLHQEIYSLSRSAVRSGAVCTACAYFPSAGEVVSFLSCFDFHLFCNRENENGVTHEREKKSNQKMGICNNFSG